MSHLSYLTGLSIGRYPLAALDLNGGSRNHTSNWLPWFVQRHGPDKECVFGFIRAGSLCVKVIQTNPRIKCPAV